MSLVSCFGDVLMNENTAEQNQIDGAIPDKEDFKKGPIPKVEVSIEKRQGNKVTTKYISSAVFFAVCLLCPFAFLMCLYFSAFLKL